MECQACIDTYVGAKRVSLLKVELIKLTIRITATPSDFEQLLIACDEESTCAFLELKKQTLSMVQKAKNYIKAAYKLKFEAPVSRSVDSIDRVSKVVCLAHCLENTNECKVCLRDASGSKSIGEFLYAIAGNELVAYVLHTLRSEDEIIRACQINSRPCACFVRSKYSHELCQEIHHTRLPNDHGSVTMSGDQPVITVKTEQNNNIPARKGPDKTSNFKCISVRFQQSEENRVRKKTRCMKCWATEYLTPVHSLHLDVAQVEPTREFLLMDSVKLRPGLSCGTCIVEHLHNLKKCYEGYHNHFDTVSTGGRISMYMPQSIRLKFVPKEKSGCVLAATQNKDETLDVQNVNAEACTRCLLEHIGHSAVSLSNDRSLMAVETLDQKKTLGNCVSKSTCQNVVFIPDEMCPQQSLHTVQSEEVMDPTDHTPNVASLPTQPDNLVAVVKEKYDEPACLVCLALLYEVLLISTVEKYVWLVKREEPEGKLPTCGSCWRGIEPFEEEENIQVNIHMMRPISAKQVQRYVHEEVSDIKDLKIERAQKKN